MVKMEFASFDWLPGPSFERSQQFLQKISQKVTATAKTNKV